MFFRWCLAYSLESLLMKEHFAPVDLENLPCLLGFGISQLNWLLLAGFLPCSEVSSTRSWPMDDLPCVLENVGFPDHGIPLNPPKKHAVAVFWGWFWSGQKFGDFSAAGDFKEPVDLGHGGFMETFTVNMFRNWIHLNPWTSTCFETTWQDEDECQVCNCNYLHL